MIILLFLLLTTTYSITEAFESSDVKIVEKYLTDFYNYNEKTGNLAEAIKEAQKVIGLPQDGKITKELIAHITKARCGKGDKQKKSKRYQVSDARWDKKVTYRFYVHDGRHPTTMTPGETRRALNVGIQYWSTVADIYFSQSPETRGSMFSISFADAQHIKYDVHVNFAEHIDIETLDNVPGGVLAHAFLPRNGNVHLDSAEEWSEYKKEGINLRLVVAHEMGHAIGLYHTNIPEALMYPAYTGYISENDFKLHTDDAQGAIELYGAKPGFRFVRSENKRGKRSENENQLCNATNINGVFEFSDGNVYVISNENKVFRVINHTIDSSFQSFKLQENLQDADAIFFDHLKMRLVVFKGDKVFSAAGLHLNNLTVSELEISLRGAFQGKVSAAFTRSNSYKSIIQKFFVIQDGELISGRIDFNRVSFSSRPEKLSNILKMSGGGHLPPSIDATIVVGRGHETRLVIFTGNSVYLGFPSGRKFVTYTIPADYPKSFKQILGC